MIGQFLSQEEGTQIGIGQLREAHLHVFPEHLAYTYHSSKNDLVFRDHLYFIISVRIIIRNHAETKFWNVYLNLMDTHQFPEVQEAFHQTLICTLSLVEKQVHNLSWLTMYRPNSKTVLLYTI